MGTEKNFLSGTKAQKKTEYSRVRQPKKAADTYNRKNVDNIKRFLIVVLLIMCVVPIMFCMYLLVRLHNMEEKLDELNGKITVEQNADSGELDGKEQAVAPNQQDVVLAQPSADEASDNLSVQQSDLLNQSSDEVSQSSADGSNQVQQKKKVYLTFDDGPNDYTAEILDVLKENNVKATFFVVYNDDEELRPLYNRIVDEGHTLGMHSYTHVYSSIYASEEAFIQDIDSIHDFLYEQTGVDCKFYRFPGGSSNTVSKVDIQTLIGILNEKGITYFDWNSLSGDAVSVGKSGAELNDMIMGYVRGNAGDSVVLMHDINTSYGTVEGLQDLIDTLRAEGYELCPITENTEPIQHVKYKGEE